MSRREQRARTREELLRAAIEVFAAHGYHATSVDMVARAAGYTKGAVYSNFDTKEELFLALLDQQLDEAAASLEQLVVSTDPAERPRALGVHRDTLAVYERSWLLLELEFALYAARHGDVGRRMAEGQRRIAQRVSALVERHLTETGIDTDVRPEDLGQLLIAAADGLALAQLTRPEVDAGRLLTLLLELLERAAHAARAPRA